MAGLWPLHGIRLRAGAVELRALTEPDLDSLAGLLPTDVEQDPAATRYVALDAGANRSAVLAQSYWRAMGLWSPADWALPLVVSAEGRVVGVQWLEGPDYPSDRVVDSSSWLVPEARGHGLGTQMRRAVLELAFGHLGAVAAISSAVVGNDGSLGVSRSLGYVATHTSLLAHSGEMLQHLRLERATWLASGRGAGVEVVGVEAALPLFGVGERP
ncbi:MAG: GNAT family N-acetyltransferase [Terracoccus sp.]